MLSLSKRQRLLIVMDDLERVDEPSLAWLAAVAQKAPRHPILLAGAIVDDLLRPLPTSLSALCDHADVIDLNQLGPHETETLMRSVFGDVANLSRCAARIYGLSQGNPRAAMELAHHLVDTGRANYESGSWVLPQQLEEDDLPATLAASWLARLAELSEDARDLVDALALADGAGLIIGDYPRLTRSADPARVFRALDELVAARVIVSDRDRCDFAQRGFIAVVRESISEERRRGLHTRIARLLQNRGCEVALCAHHLLAAGLDAEGVELLVPVATYPNTLPSALLATAVERAEALHLPASTLHRLRMGLLLAAPLDMDYENFVASRRSFWRSSSRTAASRATASSTYRRPNVWLRRSPRPKPRISRPRRTSGCTRCSKRSRARALDKHDRDDGAADLRSRDARDAARHLSPVPALAEPADRGADRRGNRGLGPRPSASHIRDLQRDPRAGVRARSRRLRRCSIPPSHARGDYYAGQLRSRVWHRSG